MVNLPSQRIFPNQAVNQAKLSQAVPARKADWGSVLADLGFMGRKRMRGFAAMVSAKRWEDPQELGGKYLIW